MGESGGERGGAGHALHLRPCIPPLSATRLTWGTSGAEAPKTCCTSCLLHKRTHIHTHTQTYGIYIHIQRHTRRHRHIDIHARRHANKYTRICMCTLTQVHTYTHIGRHCLCVYDRLSKVVRYTPTLPVCFTAFQVDTRNDQLSRN